MAYPRMCCEKSYLVPVSRLDLLLARNGGILREIYLQNDTLAITFLNQGLEWIASALRMRATGKAELAWALGSTLLLFLWCQASLRDSPHFTTAGSEQSMSYWVKLLIASLHFEHFPFMYSFELESQVTLLMNPEKSVHKVVWSFRATSSSLTLSW